ncbi:MAG TPA: HEAT repeat domain-containing protein [Methylomirabilota bacterium]|nr:HEAT repeat domain-containing protein [Methylomirabilota bacterium]
MISARQFFRLVFRALAITVVMLSFSQSCFAQIAVVKTNTPPLNEDQRRMDEWTTRQFRGFLDNRTFAGWSKTERDALEAKAIDALNGPHSREYYQAINTLGALRSTNGFKQLLAIATDRVDKDNRDRWMAIRALGHFGDKSIVPELVPLVYHGNVNTRWWAQISLVRLTGTNFAGDWRAWGAWWNHSRGQPAFATNDFVRWVNQPGWETAEQVEAKIQEGDASFFAKLPPAAEARTQP